MAIKKNIDIEQIARDKLRASGLRIKTEKKPMRLRNFRMPDREYDILKDHFLNMGISVGGGLRMIINKYLDSNNLR